jgi:hypothetical protein
VLCGAADALVDEVAAVFVDAANNKALEETARLEEKDEMEEEEEEELDLDDCASLAKL